ncbi:MAG: leucine dehydrogenase, partial [Mycoplasma sp.]|nr:leucine dehydrogenase [Mycoplasma sp.]
MTYKNAAANFYMGGGKAVIMLDENNPKTIEKLRIHAQYINTLGGRFISAKDVGTTDSDVLTMSQVSQFVLGNKFPPSKFTAYGIFVSMKAAAKWRWNNESLKDKVIAIQGLGGVGYELARYCHEAGAKLIVADINPETIEKAKKEFNVEVVSVDTILEQECDILA